MRTACIIPAYNEEKNIGNVLSTVMHVDMIDRVIVINDGSTDHTLEVAMRLGADMVNLDTNMGKGAAMKAGIDICDEDILLFLDADLVGLTAKHAEDLIRPVAGGEADMTIGLFSSGRFATDLAQKITPYLSGQRAVKRGVISGISGLEITKYGVEVAMTKYCMKTHLGIKTVELRGMTHIMKEEKLGFSQGVEARFKMYWDIIKCLRSKSTH